MNKKILTFGVVIMCVMSPQLAYASSELVVSARYIKIAQDKQARSIQEGIDLGKITPKEAKELRVEQLSIDALEVAMFKDGSITLNEISVLFAKLERARKHINRLARNSVSTSSSAAYTLNLRDNRNNTVK